MVGWLTLDGSLANPQVLEACSFRTPHWKADHHAVYVDRALAMSATQRFITPECQTGLMPFRDDNSGCVINADVYLTNREELCESLACDSQVADVKLLLQSYLKWGEQCIRHLAGQFCFMIWDPRRQHLFAAVDPFAQCPLFFVHRPLQESAEATQERRSKL
jgi:asparagine synthase (glutamine-hydrolysing)